MRGTRSSLPYACAGTADAHNQQNTRSYELSVLEEMTIDHLHAVSHGCYGLIEPHPADQNTAAILHECGAGSSAAGAYMVAAKARVIGGTIANHDVVLAKASMVPYRECARARPTKTINACARPRRIVVCARDRELASARHVRSPLRLMHATPKVGDDIVVCELQLMFAQEGETASVILNIWARSGGTCECPIFQPADDVRRVALTDVLIPLMHRTLDGGSVEVYIPVHFRCWL